ncbi:MAG: hypothetical protein WBC05_06120, partial [Sedimentisphaerales bacterium]
MDIKSLTKKAVLAAIFIAIIAGVFWLAQRNVTKDMTHCALITIMAAAILTFVYNRYFYDTVTSSKPITTANVEAIDLRTRHKLLEESARHKRLEEKIRKLNAELSGAKLKLEAEIANRPLDQRQLQQRLKHLNCLYGLSKIVNRQ